MLLAASAGLLLLTSCNNDTKVAGTSDNTMAEKNMAASHEVDKAFQTGDVSKIDSVIAKDFVDHTDRGDMVGPDSLKSMITQMHREFPDMKMEAMKEVADNDYVFSMMHYSGNSNGQMGMPKGPFDMHSVEVVRFKDGKAVEHWSFSRADEMMKMMQQMQPGSMNMNNMNKMTDTATKK